MRKMRVIVTGASGMVGGCALRICLESPVVSRVTVIGRRPTGISDTRLHEVVVDDFNDYSALPEALENQDAALYCLGAYTGAVPDDLFRRITVDYTLAFAKSLHSASPQAAFCFLSGQGADQTERSRMAFARYKGAAENALQEHVTRGPNGIVMTAGPELTQTISHAVSGALGRLRQAGKRPVVLCGPDVRLHLKQMLRTCDPDAAVLGYNEIESVEVQSLEHVGIDL